MSFFYFCWIMISKGGILSGIKIFWWFGGYFEEIIRKWFESCCRIWSLGKFVFFDIVIFFFFEIIGIGVMWMNILSINFEVFKLLSIVSISMLLFFVVRGICLCFLVIDLCKISILMVCVVYFIVEWRIWRENNRSFCGLWF